MQRRNAYVSHIDRSSSMALEGNEKSKQERETETEHKSKALYYMYGQDIDRYFKLRLWHCIGRYRLHAYTTTVEWIRIHGDIS